MKSLYLFISIILSLQIAQTDQINPSDAVLNAIHAAHVENNQKFNNIVDLEKVVLSLARILFP